MWTVAPIGKRCFVPKLIGNPFRADRRVGARLFVVAQPVSADPGLLLDTCDGRDVRRWLSAATGWPLFQRPRQYSPHIGESSDVHRRARGASRSSHQFDTDRTLPPDDRYVQHAVDLEVWEDGGIRLYYVRASDTHRDVNHDVNQLLLTAVAGEVSGVVELARTISAQPGFRGSWTFGVALRGLKSLTVFTNQIMLHEPNWKYSDDGYDEVTEVDNATLCDAGSPLLEALVGRLFRSTYRSADLVDLDVFPVTVT